MKKSSNQRNKAWTEDQDRIVTQLVEKYGTKHWAHISSELEQNYGYKFKSGKQCRQRWHNHLNPTIIKKAWSKSQEEIMFDQHRQHGNKWTIIAEALPGRTDNSIKNHFYSTIRRCLRRMSKLVGSKNSTIKMRNVKPSTLSIIFSLAERKQTDQIERDIQVDQLSDINFQELATHIMDFSKWKPTVKNEQFTVETVEKFNNMLSSMHQINQLYEKKKNIKARQRKQKMLCKKFDDICSDEDENCDDSSDNFSDNARTPIQKSSKSRRKINPPKTFEPELKSKSQKKIRTEEIDSLILEEKNELSHKQCDDCMVDGYFQTQKQNDQYEDKIQFNINIQEEEKQFENPFKYSPGFFSLTPPAITPTHNILMSNNQCQPIKNEDCNEILERLKDRITHNTAGNPQPNLDNIPFLSPGSAFRFCS